MLLELLVIYQMSEISPESGAVAEQATDVQMNKETAAPSIE